MDRTVSRAEGLPEKQRFPVEALQKKLEITASVFAGVCAANGWRPGKVMTEAEFRQAVTSFSRAPMGAPTGKER
ncbi:MAG: hypothetical protein HFG00_06445 [Oscillibacter sp.]|nr:hypothetical protein [Oscillibacter sp.]